MLPNASDVPPVADPAGHRATYAAGVLPLLLVAGSLGMSNFAASIAIGISGVDHALRMRLAFAFGLFEAGMPVVGLLLGHQLAGTLGSQAHLLGGGLLVAAGAYNLVDATRSSDQPPPARGDTGLGRLLLLGAALSIDNLIVGFALGAYGVPIALAVVVIAVVSVGMSLIGLEAGARLGTHVGYRSERLGGIVLICVGAVIAIGAL